MDKCLYRWIEFYGKCSTVVVDAIEKRPFFHITPGEKYLSVGLYGCNLSCDFCLNYDISQEFNIENAKYYSPEDLVKICKEKQAKGIIFSYSEPTIHSEYLIDVATVPNNGLIFGLKTNGFASPEVFQKLLQLYSFFNVDIKGDNEFYMNHCQNGLDKIENNVLDIIKNNVSLLVQNNKWVEISYLVNPINILDTEFHTNIAKWLSELNNDIPVHLLNFYPYYRMKQEYNRIKLLPVYEIFKSVLNNVYISNVFDEEFMKFRNSYCSVCGSEMVNRGNSIVVNKLECCGKKLAGIFGI